MFAPFCYNDAQEIFDILGSDVISYLDLTICIKPSPSITNTGFLAKCTVINKLITFYEDKIMGNGFFHM